jgi:hypothetical protein
MSRAMVLFAAEVITVIRLLHRINAGNLQEIASYPIGLSVARVTQDT